MALETALNDSGLLSPGHTGYVPVDAHMLNVTEGAGVHGSSEALAVPNDWTMALMAEASVRVLLSLLTILVNALVIVTLATTPYLRESPAHLVIGNLAVTDLMVGVMSPAGLVIELQIVISQWLCRLGYAGVLALCSVSINNLLFISVDRYLVISMPFRYVPMVTKRRVIVFIALCWMYACVLSTLFIATNYSRDGWQGQCLAEMLYPLWLMLVLTSLHFFLPFAIMMYVHIAIFVVARRQQRAVSLSFKRNGVEPNGESKRAKLRAARLLAVPCGFFHVSWGPWFIAILWAVATNNTLRPHYVERFVQTLGILNSLGNPVLYAVTQPLLGRAMLAKLKTLFSMCKSKLQDHRNKQHHVESSTLVVPENVESTTV